MILLNDIIVLSSSDDTQDDDEVKEPLIKVRSKVGRKVRRRLLQNEGIKNVDSLATTFGDRDVYSGGEDSDNGGLIGNCSDDLTVTQFESPTKKPRIDTSSDCSDDDEVEKVGYARRLLISRYT